MRDFEKRQYINSYLGFIGAASICGFIFYALVNLESYYKYETIVDGFGIIFFISGLLTLFLVLKFGNVLREAYKDRFDNDQYIGLKTENYFGLLILSLISIVLFNPFISIPQIFDSSKSADGSNQGYLFMAGFLVLNAFFYYSSRQQIKEI